MFCLYVWDFFPQTKAYPYRVNMLESTAEIRSNANTFKLLIPTTLKPNLSLDFSTMEATNAFLLQSV